MSDLDERPSKIRKLESALENDEVASILAKTTSHQPAPSTNPTNDPSQEQENVDEHPKLVIDDVLTPDTLVDQGEQPILSKSQRKRLLKQEQWEAGKEDRRLKRREKAKAKQARKAANNAELAAQAAAGKGPECAASEQLLVKAPSTVRPFQVPVSLILDCSFNELMTDKELISLGAQLTRCYADNRKAVYRSHYAISSWGGALKKRFEGPLTSNHLGWTGVRFIPEDYVAAAEQLNSVMWGSEGGIVAGPLLGENWKEKEAERIAARKARKRKPREIENQNEVESTAPNPQATDLSERETTTDGIEHTRHNTTSMDESPDDTTANSIPPSSEVDQTTIIVTESSQGPVNNQIIVADTPPNLTKQPTPPPPSIVYLTSDSPHTLSTLSPHTSYIIGGIVDKNRHKGLCYKKAQALGIPTAKLPIGEYMTMQSRSVLAINHVVEIMLGWLELGDWGEAFVRVIPKRKEARLRSEVQGDQDKNDEEGVEEDAEE